MPDIPLPKDPRHQRFADLHIFKGLTGTDAYIQAGFKVKRSTAASNAVRVMRRADVAAYIAAVRQAAATEACLTVREIREFCARVVRTPITALDPNEAQDADLIKSYAVSESELGSNRRLEKHDPFKAIEIDIKLTHEEPAAAATQEPAAAIASLSARSPLPTGKL